MQTILVIARPSEKPSWTRLNHSQSKNGPSTIIALWCSQQEYAQDSRECGGLHPNSCKACTECMHPITTASVLYGFSKHSLFTQRVLHFSIRRFCYEMWNSCSINLFQYQHCGWIGSNHCKSIHEQLFSWHSRNSFMPLFTNTIK